MRFLAATSVTLLLAAPLAFAQERGAPGWKAPQSPAERQAVEVAARVPLERPIKGAPYSADTIVESTQTLADGNHINHQTTGRVYRDGEGRVRREEERNVTVAGPNGPTTNRVVSISIVDPVGGYSYSLNTEQRIAWRTPMPASKELLDKVAAVAAQVRTMESMTPEQKAKVAEEAKLAKAELEKQMARERAAQSTDAPSKASSEAVARGAGGRGGWTAYAFVPPGPLEHKTLDGLAVEGRHTSETIPAGQIGNELPITITSEEWTSTDLKVLVLTKHNDPRTGESTYRLANVFRGEPDPSLFMVPAGYEVRDTNIRRNNE